MVKDSRTGFSKLYFFGITAAASEKRVVRLPRVLPILLPTYASGV
jgi:hypothetical protein